MCGRYSFVPTPKQRELQLGTLQFDGDLHTSFNIAPTHQANVIANNEPGALQQMEWGLVPFWSRDEKNSGKLINARSEGILEKPSFREPLRHRRCLVPADSFYEWRTGPGRRKIPYRIFRADGQLLFMAGIWDEWKSGKTIRHTFSIITITPNREMADLHDRMPLLLTAESEQQFWLKSNDIEGVLHLMQTPRDGLLEMYRVSEKLNTPGFDAEELHQKLPDEPTLF